jgi:hypothetical protein
MRLFTLIDFRHLVLAFFLGCMAAMVLYVAFRYGGTGRKGGEGRREMEEFPDGLRAGNSPVPLVLILVFTGFAVWFVLYAVFFGILGGPV